MKVGIYCRVSTEEQKKEGLSIQAQKHRCINYAKSKDWEIYSIYIDEAKTGSNKERPAFKDLMNDLNIKKIEAVLVYKIDRLTRNLKDLLALLETFKQIDIKFISVTENIDTTTAMGEAFLQIIGVFNQLEIGLVKERVNLVFNKKALDGQSLSRPQYGYSYKDKHLVPNSKANNVVEIFDMVASGTNHKEICAKFGIPRSTFYEIIKNPVYIGLMSFRGKYYKGEHKALIDLELFKTVNPQFKVPAGLVG
jgi:site-specific DNA recombinase